MEQLDCDIYADVDFGRGPVEVRCTMTGEHEVHACMIQFAPQYSETPEPKPETRNVFEENE